MTCLSFLKSQKIVAFLTGSKKVLQINRLFSKLNGVTANGYPIMSGRGVNKQVGDQISKLKDVTVKPRRNCRKNTHAENQ